MAIEALVYHPTVAHYLRFVATTVGRDKVLRTLQYFSRFLAWYLLRTNYPARHIAPFEAIKKQFGLTRKLLRVGKNVEHFKAAAIAFDAKTGPAGADPVIKYLTVGRQLGYALYLSLDAWTVPDVLGIRRSASTKTLQAYAYRAWLAGLLCSAIKSVYSLHQLDTLEDSVNKKDAESVLEGKKLAKERSQVATQLLSDCCDMVVPTSALGLIGFDDGVVGLAGTASSIIGLQQAWRKSA